MSTLRGSRARYLLSGLTDFYVQGFRGMTVGRTLWWVIGIKLLVIFGILKLFFFPDFLSSNYSNDTERSAHVLDQITSGTVSTGQPHEGGSP